MRRLIFIAVLMIPAVLLAQLDTKPLIEEVGVEEHLGKKLDLDLTFVDQSGKQVVLQDLVDTDIPTVIAPVYYTCPRMCTLILNGVRDLINESNLVLGQQYQIINVSIDPSNTPEVAAEKSANYIETLAASKQQPARENWHYLTGSETDIRKLTDQLGFYYQWINDQYSHAAVIMLLSPEGVITRYIYGVRFEPRDFRLAVVEASEGTVGSTVDRLLIYCFRYDPLAGKYVPVAWNIMRLGAGMSLFLLAAFIILLWSREFINKRRLRQNV